MYIKILKGLAFSFIFTLTMFFLFSIYLGAFKYNPMPTKRNSMFGNQIARTTGILPLIANILDMVVNSMYNALSAIPIPSWSPMPPLIFFDESDTPISIKIMAAKGLE